MDDLIWMMIVNPTLWKPYVEAYPGFFLGGA